MNSATKRILFLASGGGDLFSFVARALLSPETRFATPRATPVAIQLFTQNSESLALQKAHHLGIAVHVGEKDWTLALEKTLKSFQPHLIVLAGFTRLIPEHMIRAHPRAILNSHPSLLPAFGGKGMYGIHVHKAVLAAQVPWTGISVHWVNSQYDQGEIIAQLRVPVVSADSAEDLQARVKEAERPFYLKVIKGCLASL